MDPDTGVEVDVDRLAHNSDERTTHVHIIYTGGTVARLRPFLQSLLDQTDWHFNATLNGCDAGERRLLEAVAAEQPDRIRITVISKHRVISHGEVLDELLRIEESPYFCFVDSDVLASGPVALGDLLPPDNLVATCAGLPIWHPDDDGVMPVDYEFATGDFIRTANDNFLGCSFIAAYHTDDLRKTLDKWKITMQRYRWADLPAPVQAELEERMLRLRIYDTAKVANVLLQTPERTMKYVQVPNLVHLGGQSSAMQSHDYRGLNIVQHARLFASRRTPWLIGALWRLRGFSRPESASLGELSHRRFEAFHFLDELEAGPMSFDDAPSWIADRKTFSAINDVVRGGNAAPTA